MGADFAAIKPGDTVAVWGCGGVGLMAQKSAMLMGAERVIAIDRLPERLAMARDIIGSETINYEQSDSVLEELREFTGGKGPDACIEAVGMEAHGTGPQYAYDRVKQALHLETDRGSALREAIMACRKGGTLSILGVYGLIDKFPLGRHDEQGHHDPDRAAARPALHADDARRRAQGRARPVVPRHPPDVARGGAEGLRAVQGQAGRLYAGGVRAVSLTRDVAPGVHRVEDAYTNWYLVEDGDELTVVDAGVPTSWDSLLEAVKALGRRLEDIRALVLTHAHFDHVGFAEKARQRLDIPVYAHRREVGLTRHPTRYDHEQPRAKYLLTQPKALPIIASLTKHRAFFPSPIGEVTAYGDDDVLDVPGRPRVVFSPGTRTGTARCTCPSATRCSSGTRS